MKIYKYQLDKTVTVLEMPRGAEILHVGSDPAGHTCVWARFISNNEFILETRAICIVGTGHEHEAGLFDITSEEFDEATREWKPNGNSLTLHVQAIPMIREALSVLEKHNEVAG